MYLVYWVDRFESDELNHMAVDIICTQMGEGNIQVGCFGNHRGHMITRSNIRPCTHTAVPYFQGEEIYSAQAVL